MVHGVLRIAAHEARRYVRLVDRDLLLLAAATGLLLATLLPLASDRGLHPEKGLFTVEIDDTSPVLGIVESDERFHVFLSPLPDRFWDGGADLWILNFQIHYNPESGKSRAAARELELAARHWLDDELAAEKDLDAAFPVRVNLVYEPRAVTGPATSTSPGPGGAPGSGPEAPTGGAPRIVDDFGHQQATVLPNEVDPPFPIKSLLLTFAYLIPMNFIGQLYSGSLYADRIRSRGVLLLSTPFSGPQILLGKSLPYVVLTVVVAIATTLLIGSNVWGLLAMFPVLFFLLASALLLGLLARSPRELTFLLVAFTVLLSTFLFLPAIFIQIHPVAYLSPVTVVVDTLRGDPVQLGPFLYATVPLTLASVVIASLAVALYREEELFAPKGIFTKLADAIHALAPGPGTLVVAGALAVPFAIGLELFVLIFAVTLDVRGAFVAFLLGGAFVEEALKALPVYAHHTRAGKARRAPWLVGGCVGFGFFLGEKLALFFSLVGFGLLPLGTDALATFGVSNRPLLLVAPLLLHMGTATLTSYAARRGKTLTFLGWFAASLLHATYNTIVFAGAALGVFG